MNKPFFQSGCVHLVPQVRHLTSGRADDRFQVFFLSRLNGGNEVFQKVRKAGSQFMGGLVCLAPDTAGNPVDLFNVLQRFFLRAAWIRDSRSRSSVPSVSGSLPKEGGWYKSAPSSGMGMSSQS